MPDSIIAFTTLSLANFPISGLDYEFMKADLRISLKDFNHLGVSANFPGLQPAPPRWFGGSLFRCGWPVLLWFLAGSTAALPARDIEVVPSNAPGAAVIQAAIEKAADGDVLHIKSGLYRESIVVNKRLQLVGEAGATLDPSQPFPAAWRPAPEVGAGVYRMDLDRKPMTLCLDGKILAELDAKRAIQPGAWNWKTLLASGPPLGGFQYIRALWIYRDKGIYLHLADNADPKPLAWSVIWKRDPVVAFRNVTGASIKGLTLAHGYEGVSFLGQARQCTVSSCTIGPWDKNGVFITAGAAECLVESNQVFRGAYEDWRPVDESKARYEVWQIHKKTGFSDRVGINLIRAGANNRVHANHVYETFDGIDIGDSAIESLDKPMTSPHDDEGAEISDNLIEETRDSGIELGAGCINVRVHHNTLRHTHGGLRYKLPRIGPVFIYRNLLVDGSPGNIWYSMDDSPAEGYVYHNTVVGHGEALYYSSFETKHGIGAPHWHYYNNVFATSGGFFGDHGTKAPVNFTADYNLVTGGGKPWPNDPGKEPHSIYVKAVSFGPDYHLPPDSPAIDSGKDLSTAFHGKPLPGCEPGYFSGKAPDIGAFEAGR